MGTDLMREGDSYDNTQRLDVDDQLLYLKQQGVTFPCVAGTCARHTLLNEHTLTQLSAYRTLFERRVGGVRDGTYVGLDFSYLRTLAQLDRHVRHAFLMLSLDIEHAVRTKVVQEAMARHEDGFAITRDYFASLSPRERQRRVMELGMHKRDAHRPAPRESSEDSLSVREFVEIVTFGTLSDFYLFCSRRWNNKDMRQEHYLFKSVRRMRNACAHNNPILSGFAIRDAKNSLDDHVAQEVAHVGISKRARAKQAKSTCMQQAVTTLYTFNKLVADECCRREARHALRALVCELEAQGDILKASDSFRSSVTYLHRLVEAWY